MKKLLLFFILFFTVSRSYSQITVLSQTNVSCPGMCDGGVTFSISVPGAYTVNYGCSTTSIAAFPTSPFSITGLCACPAYNFIFSNGLGVIGFTTITIATPAPINCVFTKTNVCCFGNCNGALQANVFGGTAPYTFTWQPTGGLAYIAPGLCAGNYTLLIKDSKLCSGMFTSSITQPAPMMLSLTKTLTSCSSCCDGIANGAASGGTPGYNYTLTPGGMTNSSGNFPNLCNGSYTMCSSDASCCVTCNTISISTSTATGIQTNILSADFKIYPNPASDKILFNSKMKDVSIEMIDSRGKLIKQEKMEETNSLNVSDVAEGVYILNIKTKEGAIRKQIVIAR